MNNVAVTTSWREMESVGECVLNIQLRKAADKWTTISAKIVPHAANLVPRVLRLFGKRLVARRDSGVLEI